VFTERDIRSLKDDAIQNTRELLDQRVKLYESSGWKTRPKPEEIKEKAWRPDSKTEDAMRDIVRSTYYAQRAWFFHCALTDANRQVALGHKSREEVLGKIEELDKSDEYMECDRAIEATLKNWLRSEAGEEVDGYPDSRWCLRSWFQLAGSLERELYPGRPLPLIWPLESSAPPIHSD
jgi:hypothetical protein